MLAGCEKSTPERKSLHLPLLTEKLEWCIPQQNVHQTFIVNIGVGEGKIALSAFLHLIRRREATLFKRVEHGQNHIC